MRGKARMAVTSPRKRFFLDQTRSPVNRKNQYYHFSNNARRSELPDVVRTVFFPRSEIARDGIKIFLPIEFLKLFEEPLTSYRRSLTNDGTNKIKMITINEYFLFVSPLLRKHPLVKFRP